MVDCWLSHKLIQIRDIKDSSVYFLIVFMGGGFTAYSNNDERVWGHELRLFSP